MELRSAPTPQPPSPRSPFTALLVVSNLLLASVAGYALVQGTPAAEAVSDTESLRKVASKLRAAGATDEAAALYAKVLTSPDAQPKRAQIAFSLGEMYLESAQYEKALRWFYEAELSQPKALRADIAQKIVHCLERLGRVHAARAALSGSVNLETNEVQRAEGDPTVATIANRDIPYSEVQRAIDDLPPEYSKQFDQKKGKEMFLRKFVADELLWRKAQKLEYDRDPDIQRQLTMLHKQIVVAKFVEQEVMSKIQIDPTDVRNYYEANKERFKKDDKEIPFEQAISQVEGAYRMMKFQAAYAELVESELSTGDVQVFADRLPQ